MSDIPRRDALKQLISAPLAAGLAWTPAEARAARAGADAARQVATNSQTIFTPSFLTQHEYATVTTLTEMILPADDRSGGASSAGVPEFIDFMMLDQPDRQRTIQNGLSWLDTECRRRFDQSFVDCSDEERAGLLDDIAWPGRASETLEEGVRFFSNIRDLAATGFWTSREGIDDLQYLGNRYLSNWQGCPPDALAKLGVRYED